MSLDVTGLTAMPVQATPLLLSATGSLSLPATVATLHIRPGTLVTVTVIISVTLAPLATVPMVHVTTPFDSVQVGDAETNHAPSGMASVSTTPVAGWGPPLYTRTEYVKLLPTVTGSVVSMLLTAKSAPVTGALTKVQAAAVLFEGEGSAVSTSTLAKVQIVPGTSGDTTTRTFLAVPLAQVPNTQCYLPLVRL